MPVNITVHHFDIHKSRELRIVKSRQDKGRLGYREKKYDAENAKSQVGFPSPFLIYGFQHG